MDRLTSREWCLGDACSTREPSPDSSEKTPEYTPRRSYSFDRTAKCSELQTLSTEIVSSVAHLYKEFLHDYTQRVNLRLKSKNPLEDLQRYSLKIDHTHSRSLEARVAELAYSAARPHLVESLIECSINFVHELDQQLQELQGKSRLLRIICLNEAFSTLSNASWEIGKIVYPLLDNSLIYRNFQGKVLRNNQDLVHFADEEGPRHWAIKDFFSVQAQLESCRPEDASTNWSSGSGDESTQEHLQKLPVDELVSFIEGEEQKKKRRKRRRKGEDVELLTFKQRLQQLSVAENRLKPCISEEYLMTLRQRLSNARS